MSSLLIDTSVLLKWLHSDGESELEEACALRSAHVTGALDAHVLDLAFYELGNVLTRALRWAAADVADQLDDLNALVGPALAMTPPWLRRAATLAHTHALSSYDPLCAAAAFDLDIPLASPDRRVLAAGRARAPRPPD